MSAHREQKILDQKKRFSSAKDAISDACLMSVPTLKACQQKTRLTQSPLAAYFQMNTKVFL